MTNIDSRSKAIVENIANTQNVVANCYKDIEQFSSLLNDIKNMK